MNEQPKQRRGPLLWFSSRSWRTRIAILLLIPVPYLVGFGPVCWWFSESEIQGDMELYIAPQIYWPVGWLANDGPELLSDAINWYGTLGTTNWVYVPTNRSSTRWIVLVQRDTFSRGPPKEKRDTSDAE